MNLHLREIQLSLGEFTLAIDVAFEGSITGIFGPSGAGKTSLLNVIAGLRRPEAGGIELDGQLLFEAATHRHVPPRLRRIGYVPQDLALFPHLNVRANLAYGCQREGANNEPFSIGHVTEVMDIGPLLERYVTTLSGGEQQRVAFARAILSVPRLLLLDEPMSSLDSHLKKRLIPFLLRIRDEFGIPLIYVTHDATELSALCDEVIVLERGRLEARGAPEELLVD